MTSVRGHDREGERDPDVASVAAVFDRLVEAVDGPGPSSGPGAGPAGARRDPRPGDVRLEELRAAVMRSVDLYSDLLQQVLGLYAEAVQGRLEQDGVGSSQPGAPVELAGRCGGRARARLWIHNATPAPLPATRLRLTDLCAHDGSRLVDCAAFDPPTLQVPAGGSAASWLEVLLPLEVGPGTYHGSVLATGLPEARVPVRLAVAP